MDTPNVRAGNFEGPLELLLELIEKRKMHVSDVSLSAITEEYLAHVRALQELPTADVAQFVLVASTLLLIKSRSLLPQLSFTPEEEGDMKSLEERLKFLERIRSLSPEVARRMGASPLFIGGFDRSRTVIFSPSKDLSLQSLSTAIRAALENLPLLSHLPKVVVEKVISLEEMMRKLSSRIEQSFQMSFHEFSKGHVKEKKVFIVGFLALLELVKQGILIANQEKHFEDIHIHKDTIGVPEYN